MSDILMTETKAKRQGKQSTFIYWSGWFHNMELFPFSHKVTNSVNSTTLLESKKSWDRWILKTNYIQILPSGNRTSNNLWLYAQYTLNKAMILAQKIRTRYIIMQKISVGMFPSSINVMLLVLWINSVNTRSICYTFILLYNVQWHKHITLSKEH